MKKTIFYSLLSALLASFLAAQPLTILYPGWDDDSVISELASAVIEDELGIEVELKKMPLNEVYRSIAEGKGDLFMGAWLPFTQSEYWEQYSERYETLGTFMPKAKIGLAVPEYVKVESLFRLNDHVDALGGSIIGIEADAGITRRTELFIREYELNYSQKNSSTQEMIEALEAAIEAREPIVVTAWDPHWMFAKYDIRMLADPDNISPADGLRKFARDGFSKDHPEVAHFLSQFTMKHAPFNQLLLMCHESDQDTATVVREWMRDNPEKVAFWTEPEKKSFWGIF